MDLSCVWVIIPAYNEERTIGAVIDSLREEGFVNLIVVNDGSCDRTAQIARSKGVFLLNHAVNCGLGAALSTGLAYLRKSHLDDLKAALTFDADGQHLASDALKVLQPVLEQEADFVVGSRTRIDRKQMPLLRRWGNYLFNLIIYLLCGVKTSDSQSGLRAFSPKAVKSIRPLSSGYEVSSEFFQEAERNKLVYEEVPVNTVYTTYSLSKGQSLSQALYTVRSFLMPAKT